MVSTLHKFLTIAFLTVSFFISGLNADLVSAQRSAPNPVVTLTPEEKAWLEKHPRIRLATLTNQPPFSMLEKMGTSVLFVYLNKNRVVGLLVTAYECAWSLTPKLVKRYQFLG